MQLRAAIRGLLCLSVFSLVFTRAPKIAASNVDSMPAYRPGHFLNESTYLYLSKTYTKLVNLTYEKVSEGDASGEAKARADAYWWKRAWSVAAECEQLSAARLVLSHPDTRLYYSAFSPVEERRSGTYYYSHESGAGFRVALQLRVDARGQATNDPKGQLLSVLTFWDFDFATGRVLPLGGMDSLRVRTASWPQLRSNVALGLSYTTMRDADGSMLRLEAGQYSDLTNRPNSATIESPAQIDSCGGCHFGEETNVPAHAFGSKLDMHSGYRVFRDYILGNDIGPALERAHDEDEGGSNNNRRDRRKKHSHKRVRKPAARDQGEASKQEAVRIAEAMQDETKAKALFLQTGAVAAIEARWHELANSQNFCVEPIHDEAAVHRLVEKVKSVPPTSASLRAQFALFLDDELSYMRDASGTYLQSPLRGSLSKVFAELHATNLRSAGKLQITGLKLDQFNHQSDDPLRFRASVVLDVSYKAQVFALRIPVSGLYDGATFTADTDAQVDSVLPEALRVSPPIALVAKNLRPTTESIQEDVINRVCTGCHSGKEAPAGLDLSDLKALLSKKHDEQRDGVHEALAYIEPGRPLDSLIYRHIVSQDPQEVMPPPSSGLPYLGTKTIRMIRDWIEGLVFDLSEEGPRPGRYLGYAVMDGQALKIPVTSDLVLSDDSNFSHYRAIIRLSLGGHASDEYQAQFYDTVAYSIERDELQFTAAVEENKGDLSFEKVEVYRDDEHVINLKGNLKTNAGATIGRAHLRWQPEDHRDASGIADIYKDKPVFPKISGHYAGVCHGKALDVQLLMSRVGYRDDLQNRVAMDSMFPDYAISGRFYNEGGELIQWATRTELDIFHSELSIITNGDIYDCKVTEGGLSCHEGACMFKRDTKRLALLGEGHKGPPIRNSAAEVVAYQRFPRQWSIELHDEDPEVLTREPEKVEGVYCGYLHHEALNTYQRMCTRVTGIGSEEFFTHNVEKHDIAVTSTLNFGAPKASKDHMTYQFDRRTFLNRVFPYFSLEGATDALQQINAWTSVGMRGVFYAKSFGRVGTFELLRGSEPEAPSEVYTMPSISRCLTYKAGHNERELTLKALRAGPLVSHLVGPFHWSIFGKERMDHQANRSYSDDINEGHYDVFTNALAMVVTPKQGSSAAGEYIMHGHAYQGQMRLISVGAPLHSGTKRREFYEVYHDCQAK